jgi:hypothetical protein
MATSASLLPGAGTRPAPVMKLVPILEATG